MKVLKTAAIVLGSLLALIFIAALVIPAIFKDDIEALATKELNKRLNAEVSFEEVSVSLFHDFPNLSLIVENFRVAGEGPFEGVDLAKGKELSVSLNLFSVLIGSRPLEIVSVFMDQPEVKVLVLRDGSANYNIMRESAESVTDSTADEGSMVVNLKQYAIRKANIQYDDFSADTHVTLEGLNHSGSGNFSGENFDLNTHSEINATSVQFGGISYLNAATVALDAIVQIDQGQQKYTFKDNRLLVNAFPLNFNGFAQSSGEDWVMDLTVGSPESEFKEFLSLIPNAYTESFDQIKASGKFGFEAFVKGTYSAVSERYPAFNLKLQIDEGSVHFPDLPQPIKEIDLRAVINSPSEDLDDMTFDVPRFAIHIGSEQIAGSLYMEKPISDPSVQAEIQGAINLDDWKEAFPMEEVADLSGRVEADMELQTRMSLVEAGAYNEIIARGQIALDDLVYRSGEYPPIQVSHAVISLDPRRLNIERFVASLGSSDLRVEGSFDNYLAYIAPEKTMNGNLQLRSDWIDFNEWYDPDANTPEGKIMMDSTSVQGEGDIFDRFQISLDAEVGRILFDTLAFSNTALLATATPNRMDIKNFSTTWGSSDIRASGRISQLFDYMYDEGVLVGNVDLRSGYLDLNAFMGEEDDGSANADSTESLSPFILPKNVNLAGRFRADKLLYSNMTLEGLDATLSLADRELIIQEAGANTMKGRIEVVGAYETKDNVQPGFVLKLDLSQMDFQEAFTSMNTFATLAPIGKFVDGVFSANLAMEGKLQADMMPDLNSLTALGYLETVNGVIQNFKPLQALGEKLNAPFLSDGWEIENTRNWFEVIDGKLSVKPFDIRVKNIPMTISGYHGLTNKQMNYDIQATIPRDQLAKSGLGSTAEQGLSFLEQQAAKLGFDVTPGADLRVGINLTGSMNQPNIGLNLLGTGPPGALDPAAGSPLGNVAAPITGNVDSLQKEGQALLDSLIKDPAKSLDQLLDSNSVDDIKKGLERFNPFKKKKQNENDSE